MKFNLYDQINSFLKNQNKMNISENKEEIILEGDYNYLLESNEVIFNNIRKIKIVIPKRYPLEIPVLFVNDIPKNMEHVYNDKSVCLATNGEIIDFLSNRRTFKEFINKFINPFIFTMDWYQEYNTYPFGERRHGSEGALSYYLEEWKLSFEQYKKMIRIILKNKYNKNSLCFCDSGKKIKDCHGKKVLSIMRNEYYKKLFLKEAGEIILNGGKYGK